MKVDTMLNREEYERLEARFAEELKFFESWTGQYPLLEDIIAGKTSFADKEVEFFAEYRRDVTTFLDFDSFVEMVEEITGLKLNVFDMMLEDTLHKSDDWFKPIVEACAELDRRIRRCYGLAFLRQTPEAFEEACSALEPAEQAYVRMKMFEQLDAEYAAFGKTLNSLCEQYSFVERIADGKATFVGTARSLEKMIHNMQPTLRELFTITPGEVPERSKPYQEELLSFTAVVDSLTGEKIEYGVLDFHIIVGCLLGGIEFRGDSWSTYKFLDDEFERYIALSEKLDRKLCFHLAPRFVTDAPDHFRKAYESAHPIEQEYVRVKLSKALGAGAIRGMDECELHRFLDNLNN